MKSTILDRTKSTAVPRLAMQTKMLPYKRLRSYKYEQQADRLSRQVMRMNPLHQRKQESLRLKPLVGHQETGKTGESEAPLSVRQVLRSPGRLLGPDTRSFMESRFGHDFSRVRVHADRRAVQSARDVASRAYTVGRDVVFGAGQYRPATAEGRRLLAHELVHTLQAENVPHLQRDRPRAPTVPDVVSWTTRTSGLTESDNCCSICPVALGVDIDPPNYRNGIELKATVRDHSVDFSYDIKRTKEAKYWRRNGAGNPWSTIATWNKPAGSDDDRSNSDECLTPVADGSNHKIYSEDRPGFLPSNLSNSYTDYVQIINFIEVVRISKPDGTTVDDATTQDWHTKMWVTKDALNNWSVNTANSEIGTGHLASLNP